MSTFLTIGWYYTMTIDNFWTYIKKNIDLKFVLSTVQENDNYFCQKVKNGRWFIQQYQQFCLTLLKGLYDLERIFYHIPKIRLISK